MKLNFKKDAEVTKATCRGRPIKTIETSWLEHRTLWVFGREWGPDALVGALGCDAAYEKWLDEQPAIPEDEIPEAYGFYGDNAKQDLEQVLWGATEGLCDYPELMEGYAYQPNAGQGSGIVDVGHYLWFREVHTSEDLENLEIKISVEVVR